MEGTNVAQTVFITHQFASCSFRIVHKQLLLFEEVKLSAAFYAGRVCANVISTAVKQMKIVV